MNKKFVLMIIEDIAIAVVLALIILYFVQPSIVRQTSMEETFHDGDYLLVSKQAYRSHEPERGDIITFKVYSDDVPGTSPIYIKRIIGMPGDEIMIHDGNVYVNGKVLDEPYVYGAPTEAHDHPADGESITVPDGSYFVMGDHREASKDSRDASVGFASRDRIVGRVFLRLFPLNKIGRF